MMRGKRNRDGVVVLNSGHLTKRRWQLVCKMHVSCYFYCYCSDFQKKKKKNQSTKRA